MNRDEAAQRLGVADYEVTDVREHPAGHLVDLRNGTTMLVSATVARLYIPDIDDAAEAPKPAKAARGRKTA